MDRELGTVIMGRESEGLGHLIMNTPSFFIVFLIDCLACRALLYSASVMQGPFETWSSQLNAQLWTIRKGVIQATRDVLAFPGQLSGQDLAIEQGIYPRVA